MVSLPNIFMPDEIERRKRLLNWYFMSGEFLPTDISDLTLWLDGDDAGTITLNGSNVAQWDDKSGNANHAVQGTASQQPPYLASGSGINGRGSVDFIGDTDATDVLEVPSAASIDDLWSGGGYLAMPFRRDVNRLSGFFGKFLNPNNGWLVRIRQTTASYELYFETAFDNTNGQWETPAATSLTTGTTYVLEISHDTDNVANDPTILVNGVTQAVTEELTPVGTYGTDVGRDLLIGNTFAENAAFDGPMGEFVCYSSIPSAGEQLLLRNYLAGRWGVSI